MKPVIRSSIAYVAGCLVNRKSFGTISDMAQNRLLKMDGRFDGGNIDVQDLENGSTLMGMTMAPDASFFHSGENATISIRFNGTLFTGKDGVSGRNFNGAVQGTSVKVYDYDEGKHFDFLLSD